MGVSLRKLVTLILLAGLVLGALALRSVPLATRQTNRTMLVGGRIVVFPVCEYSLLFGYGDGFPTQEADGTLRC